MHTLNKKRCKNLSLPASLKASPIIINKIPNCDTGTEHKDKLIHKEKNLQNHKFVIPCLQQFRSSNHLAAILQLFK